MIRIPSEFTLPIRTLPSAAAIERAPVEVLLIAAAVMVPFLPLIAERVPLLVT